MKIKKERVAFISHPSPFSKYAQENYGWEIISDRQSLDKINFNQIDWIVILAELDWKNNKKQQIPKNNFYGIRLPQILIEKDYQLVEKIILFSNYSEDFILKLNQNKKNLLEKTRTDIFCFKTLDESILYDNHNKMVFIYPNEILENSFRALKSLLKYSDHEGTLVEILQNLSYHLYDITQSLELETFISEKSELISSFYPYLHKKLVKINFHLQSFSKSSLFNYSDKKNISQSYLNLKKNSKNTIQQINFLLNNFSQLKKDEELKIFNMKDSFFLKAENNVELLLKSLDKIT